MSEYRIKERVFEILNEKLRELKNEFNELHNADLDVARERYGYISSSSSEFLRGICVGIARSANLILLTKKELDKTPSETDRGEK